MPNKGYKVLSLTANGKNILPSGDFVVESAVVVAATFQKETFKVTRIEPKNGKFTLKTDDGKGSLLTPEMLTKIPYGTSILVDFTPDADYILDAIKVNDQIISGKTFVVKGETKVEVLFKKDTKIYSVTQAKEGEGTLEITGASDLKQVKQGTKLTVKAKAAEGYKLTHVIVSANGKETKHTEATFSVVVESNLVIKAVFAKDIKYFSVEHAKEGEGTLEITGASDLKQVKQGTQLSITAKASEGYKLSHVIVNANGKETKYTDATFTVVVESNLVIKAVFAQDTALGELSTEAPTIVKTYSVEGIERTTL